MSKFIRESIIRTAEQWDKSHLDMYIKELEDQVEDIQYLLKGLKSIQTKKQKEINRKLRDSGPRGAA